MSFLLFKIVENIKAPVMWLYKFISDQTKIVLVGQTANGLPNNTLYISRNNKSEGNFIFGITTFSKCTTEILKIEIDYSAPLQILDPKKMGFFQYSNSNDATFPFRIFSEGCFEIHSELTQGFALSVKFPSGVHKIPINISVHARVRKTVAGGFKSYGREQISKRRYWLEVCEFPLLGIALKPKHSFSSPQPYVIQSQSFATGTSINVLVHEGNKDGIVSSRIFEQKLEDKNNH